MIHTLTRLSTVRSNGLIEGETYSTRPSTFLGPLRGYSSNNLKCYVGISLVLWCRPIVRDLLSRSSYVICLYKPFKTQMIFPRLPFFDRRHSMD